jgi:hypothetical protein
MGENENVCMEISLNYLIIDERGIFDLWSESSNVD